MVTLTTHRRLWVTSLLILCISAVTLHAASLVWTNTASGSFGTAANWNPNAVPGSDDLAIITNGGIYTVSLDTPRTVGGLRLGESSGVSTQTLSLNGNALVLSRGSIVNPNGVIIVSGNLGISGFYLTNNGTVTWTAGTITSGSSAVIENNGLWDAQGNNTFAFSGANNSPIFNNNTGGILRKSGGSGTTAFGSSFYFNNAGLVDVQTGTFSTWIGGSTAGTFNAASGATLRIDSDYTFNSGSQFTGTGLHLLANGRFTLNGNITFSTLEQSGGTLAGSHVLTGIFVFRGGDWVSYGGTTIAAGGTLNITSGLNLSTRSLTNNGTVIWTAGTITDGGSAVIENNGLWDAQSNNTFAFSGANNSPAFNNHAGGILRKSGGSGTTAFGSSFYFNNNGGLVDVQTGTFSTWIGGSTAGTFNAASGATLRIDSDYTFNSGSQFTGAGLHLLANGRFTLNGNITFSTLEQSGGTLAGSHVLNGIFTFGGGDWVSYGSTTIAEGGTLNITSGLNLSTRSLTNNGTVNWTAGTITDGGSAVIQNNGLWDAQGNNTFSFSGANNSPVFNNNAGGILRKSGSSGTTAFGSSFYFNNTGSLDVERGTLSFLSTTLSFSQNATFQSRVGATLQLSTDGNLISAATDPARYLPKGRVLFDSGGSRQLEVMSQDLGSTLSGFSSGFAYGTLELSGGTQLRLVNKYLNSSTNEALYVENLSVPKGSALDLNGFHAYFKVSQIYGTVSGGTLSAVPDPQPPGLEIDHVYYRAIPFAGQSAGLNFFGRAGENVTIVVDTGSSTVPIPQVGYAEVSLLDPPSKLLAQASNDVANQLALISEFILPADGTYHVQVKAPENHPASSGNFAVAILDSGVQVAPLVMNDTTYGRLATRYNADRWTFSGVSGQQVRFNLVNTSGPGVLFTLKGPDGWIGFTNLAASTGLIDLPTSGTYSLTAQGAGEADGIAYAFQLVETRQTDLPLGTSYTGQFVGSGQAQGFRIKITETGPVVVTLRNAGVGNLATLYVARNGLPTLGSFDYSSASGPGANRQLLIPSGSIGDYYVLVYGDNIPEPGAFTIEVDARKVILSDITPTNQANNVPFTLTVKGAGFDAGIVAELIGDALLTATRVSVDSFSQLSATFPGGLGQPGTYSLRVRRFDGSSDTLTNIFVLLPSGEPKLETHLILPSALGRHQVSTLFVEYANTGTASMPAPLLKLHSIDPDNSDRPIFTLDESRVIQEYWSAILPAGTSHEIFLLGSGAQPGLLNPGERIRVPVYYLGLQQPWDFSDSKVELQISYWTADNTTPIDWAAQKESQRPPTVDASTWDLVFANITTGLTNTGAYVGLLSKNARYLAQLGKRVVEADKLWNFEVQKHYGFLAKIPLDSARDAAVVAPEMDLHLLRRFSGDLLSRNRRGLFGWGWHTPFQSQLRVLSNGDQVQLIGEGGAVRAFTRDTRNGSYFSAIGDSSTLARIADGVYTLQTPDGIATRFRTDGKVDFIQTPNGNRVTAQYNDSGQLLTLTHTSGAFLSIRYNPSGSISNITNSAGRSVVYEYDDSNSYLQSVTADGIVTRYLYDTSPTTIQRHALTSVTRAGVTRSFTYDSDGRLSSTYIGAGDQLVRYSYDDAGEVQISDALGTNHVFFDENGQVAKLVDALGNNTSVEFDENLRLKRTIEPTGESKSFTWCNCGSLTSWIDELGNKNTFSYDNVLKRLTSVTDARGNSISSAYDANGNLLQTLYPNRSIEQFSNYTGTGRFQTRRNRRGEAIHYTYNASGQVTNQSFANGSSVDFSYDVRGNLTQIAEHTVSGISKITTYTYNYDTDGDRLRQVTYPNGRWVAYAYDAFGRRQQISDSTGWTNSYSYDSLGRLRRLSDGSDNLITEYLYNAVGLLQRVNKGNGTYTTYDYDAAGQILHLTNFGPGSVVNSRFDYTYDNRGRRLTLQTTDGNWNYSYDGIGQLVGAVFTSSNPSIPNQDLRYNYDAVGNRTSSVINGTSTKYLANNLNQYTSIGGSVPQYDADGNLTSDGVRSYVYDTLNRLVSVTGPEGVTGYEYDALGNRTASVVNGQRTEYLLDLNGTPSVVGELDGNGNVIAHYAHGQGLEARVSDSVGRSYYAFDAIGSTTEISDSQGTPVNRYGYLPFGEKLYSSEPSPNAFQFVGQRGVTYEGSGLSFMQARFYAPMVGSFTTVDPIRLEGGDVNYYRYAANSPTRFTDPLGLRCRPPKPVPSDPDPFTGGILGLLRQGESGSINKAQADQLDALDDSDCPNRPPKPPGPPEPRPGNPGEPGEPGVPDSHDPNGKLGPSGVGSGRYLLPGSVMPYRVDFENASDATAPAQQVTITDQLSANLDWNTFQLTEIGFGDEMIAVPANSQRFQTTLKLTCCGDPFEAHIEAGIHTSSGQVYLTIRSIDPATSLPPAVSVGFLPPEDRTGRGQGHFSYLINAKANLPSGAQISNIASISFDNQPIITTDQIDTHNPAAGIDPTKQARNLIDALPPTSQMLALSPTNESVFLVQWAGKDDMAGSGIADYSVYVSTNGVAFTPWIPHTNALSAYFTGRLGRTYSFYCTASDLVGNQESFSPVVQASTTVANVTFAPVVLQVTAYANGHPVLSVDGSVGPDYVIMSSTDLTTWSDLFTNSPALMPFQFEDTYSTQSSNRFYRVRLIP